MGNFIFISSSELTAKEISVWETKDQILSCIGGLPENVNKILITENLDNISKRKGLYLPERNVIIIARETLDSVTSFLATLLHELALAKSEKGLFTKEYEIELSYLLGLIGQEIVRLTKETSSTEHKENSKRANDAYAIKIHESISNNNVRKKQYYLICELRSQGLTMFEIANEMNERGEKTPTGKNWSTAIISLVLSRWNRYFE